MSPRRGSARRAWLRWAVGLVAVGLVVAAFGLEVLDRDPGLQLHARWLTVAASFIAVTPVLVGVACLLLLVALRGWWRLVVVVLALALAGQLVVEATHRPVRTGVQANFVVLTLNTYYGWADTDALARRAASADADVVVLPEITTRTLTGLGRTDWAGRYPYTAGTAAGDWDDTGLMVFSRYPLTLSGDGPRTGVGLRVEVARPQRPVTLIAVHFTNPVVGWNEWTGEFAWLADAVEQPPARPVVVAGDFNAVPAHERFRALLQQADLRDAAAEVGHLWSPTFPSSRTYPPPGRWAAPIMQLDHVLVGPGAATDSLTTFRVDGTDHRGLVARLRVD